MSEDMRAARRAAHLAFDGMWKRKAQLNGWHKTKARAKGYQWLAKRLGIAASDPHMSKMDAETCSRVVDLCTNLDWIIDPYRPRPIGSEGG